ncbi:MAG TPA: hypothetical protein VMF09_16850 [Solirubrobacteraceae bacterium]|nr:hypothetical protein [Solirubrobacteraceae bacterium]
MIEDSFGDSQQVRDRRALGECPGDGRDDIAVMEAVLGRGQAGG